MANADKGSNVQHVAIIMDGNGRWAKQRGLEHIAGHREGAKAVERTIKAAKEFGVKYLTLYAFSTENWNRPEAEVKGLMSLLREFVDNNLKSIKAEGIRVKVAGRIEDIPYLTRRKLLKAVKETENNSAGTVVLAISYGGRAEIVDSAKKFAKDVLDGKIKIDSLDENSFRSYLYVPDVPDPDLMIRTSGELRLSNFLLWQLSYAEFYITDLLWPDFDRDEFKKALDSFGSRNRRYGGR